MKFIELIEELQKLTNKKITHTELAEILGCGRANISKKANVANSSEVTVAELIKIQNFYNVNLIKNNSTEESFIIIAPENAQSITVRINSGQTVKVEVV